MQQHNPAPTSEFLKQALTQATEVALGTTGISKSKPLHTLVGASVAVCLFDTRLYSCAVRLVMLPTLAQSNRQDASLQADAALEDVLTQLCPAENFSAADKIQKRIRAKIFGGADLKPTEHGFLNGAKSVNFVRNWLKTRHIPVVAENIGGLRLREILLLPRQGVVYCRAQELDDDFLEAERSGLSAKASNHIELF